MECKMAGFHSSVRVFEGGGVTKFAEILKGSGQQVVDRGHLIFIWECEACQSSRGKKTKTVSESRQRFVMYL